MSLDDVLHYEMDEPIGHDDGPDPLDGTEGAVRVGDYALFVEDLRTAFPETPLPQRVAEDHIAAMVGAIQLLADKGESALEPTSNAQGPDRRASGLPKLRRITMRKRMIAKLAVAMAMLLSLAGLANAGMLPHRIQSAVDQVLGINASEADDQGENADDQGEDVNLVGDEVEHGGLVGADLAGDENDVADENDAADVNEGADDQGENADDQGDDSQSVDGDQGDDSQSVDGDQGDDSQSVDGDQGDDSQSVDGDQGDGGANSDQ
jgi:hypothetical protein